MTEEINVLPPDTDIVEPPDPTLTVPPAPLVETPPEPPPVPEQRYEYQPMDKLGRPLGGKQVIIYRTQEELVSKLTAQNNELVGKLREVSRRQKLGIADEEAVPADLEREAKIPKFERRPLTTEERYILAQDLNDPEKCEAARDKLLESAGYNEMQQTVQSQQLALNQLLARTNAQVFLEQHPDFYACEENLGTITAWMVKNELHPSVRNFETAYSAMQRAGLLIASPIVREEAPKPAVAATENTVPNTPEPVAPVSRITDEVQQPQPPKPARVPSGINSRVASSATELPPDSSTLTIGEIERMPSDVYKKRLLTDPGFSEAVERAYSKVPPRPQARRS
jgi:hypothetical protein